MQDLVAELSWRGLVYDKTEGVSELLTSKIVTAYTGFDPTADSLHVGSLLPIMGLVRLQRHGHQPIAVVGGGTGMIGDPSGKSQERVLLTNDVLAQNVAGIRAQLERFIDFDGSKTGAILVNNADWLTQMNFIEFLRDVGKHFTVNYMMAKDSVKRRVDGGEEGISFTEFSYMILQAYDFFHLYKEYGCELQLGGSDQWGNITAGSEYIRRMLGKKSHGLVYPLVTTAAGTKFGKTEAGTVWLDAKRTSPYRFYQFWLNTSDAEVAKYLKYFTLLGQEEIAALEAAVVSAPEKREAQKQLAHLVTGMVHGETALSQAVLASEVMFGGDLNRLDAAAIADVFSEVPSTELNRDEFPMGILDLFVHGELAASKGEARRLLQGGGLYINNQRATDATMQMELSHAIEGKYFVLRKGAKSYHLLKLQD